jgi:hypothetical protein
VRACVRACARARFFILFFMHMGIQKRLAVYLHSYFQFLQCIQIRSLFTTTGTKALTWPLSSGKVIRCALSCRILKTFISISPFHLRRLPCGFSTFLGISNACTIQANKNGSQYSSLPHVYIFFEPSVLSLCNIDSCVILLDVWQCSVDWK